jgi:capsular exopolysaccharide synthesis family protein
MASEVAHSLGLDKGKSATERRALLDELQKNVGAKRTGESYALTISYDAPSAQDAATLANEFAKQFSNWEVQADRERNAQARKEVEARLAELRVQAQTDTQALQQYRISNNLLTTSGASLTEQEISNYNLEATRARAQSAEDQARLQTALAQLRSGSSGDDVGEALGSTVISSLRTQEAQLAGEVANLSARYGPNHPQLIRTQGQLKEIRDRIQAEIGRVISNLRAKQEVSEQRLSSLNSSLYGARSNLSQNNAAMVGLIGLERAAEASQGIYETYLNRYKQLLAAEGTEKPSARVLTLAVPPLEPRSPNLKLNLALSIIIGLGLGVVAAYIAEALFHGITSADEVERELGERFLTSIPLLASVDPRNPHAVKAIREDPKSVFTESFRSLGISIDQAMRGPAQVIAITSALPGEGKTVMSCCLAHVLATSGERTILIDCDLRRRGISRLLDVKPDQKGLVEILNGSTPFKFDQLIGDRVFCVLPLMPSDEESEHLLTGQPFVELLDKLRQHFDRIVLDLPPVLPIAATRTLAARADAVVLAARWRKTSAFAIRAARSRLPDDQVNVVGVALNQVDIRRRGYFDRNDVAFYYNQYKEYYG